MKVDENETPSYVSHVYHDYNQAVNMALGQHHAVVQQSRHEARIRFMQSALWFLAVMGAALAIVALIYWVWFAAPKLEQSGVSQQTTGELRELSAGQQPKEYGVQREFTVFDRTPTETGEIVITAKQFSPEDLSAPHYQYCYLATGAVIGNSEATELAFIDENGLTVVVEDAYLTEQALPLCTFDEVAAEASPNG